LRRLSLVGPLHKLWNAWKRLGRALGDFLARIVLSIFYITVFMPFGLGVRLAGDLLKTKKHTNEWLARTTSDPSLSEARRLS
jgi:hypothetical protein